jgi:hypothetical protein
LVVVGVKFNPTTNIAQHDKEIDWCVMRLGPIVMALVVAMTTLFALFFLFSIIALINLFYPMGFSYGKEREFANAICRLCRVCHDRLDNGNNRSLQIQREIISVLLCMLARASLIDINCLGLGVKFYPTNQPY